MDTLKIQRNSSSIDWKPSPIVALATSTDESRVAAAREDGSLEIWLVSPGSVTWHCQLTIQADSNSRISSLVWCPSGSKKGPSERLLSSSIDGSISEWDLFDLKQKTVLDSVGVSIWQMAVEPIEDVEASLCKVNGSANVKSLARDDDDDETSEIDDDVDAVVHLKPTHENRRVAVGCDDGCVRLYAVPASDELIYNRSFPRVSGRVLSVVWSLDSKLIFSGSSDGFIRCWDAKLAHEMYRITVGHGGFGSGPELCIWSLLFLRSGTIVSGDGSGSVQFWDSRHGTLLQTHSCHKGDVNALAAAPSHNRVFSAGSDGQVVLYKLSSDAAVSGIIKSSNGIIRKWVYVGYVRAHTHDVRTLTVAVPISTAPLPNEKVKKARCRKKPTNSSYYKWAYPGSPMLISAGDDTKLFSYSVKEFTKFSPHDICPAPQRVPMQMVLSPTFSGASLVMVQCSSSLDILRVTKKAFGADKSTQLVTRIKSKAARKIICSTISSSGTFFAYSDHVTPSLFQLKISGEGKSTWAVPEKRPLPRKLPYARSMVFNTDSSRLMIAGEDKKIYVVDVNSAGLLHTFRPRRKVDDDSLPAMEPPITKMFTSSDGQWLAAINCFGDIYVFNLEIQRQHWFISRLDGACVTAGGFSPSENNMLIITTSSNQVYALDVEAKQLGEWSMHQTCVLPRRFQELPGEVIGLSFPPSCSTSVTIYSSRAMCSIDYGMPVPQDDDSDLANSIDLTLKKLQNSPNIKVLKRKRRKDALQTNLKQKFDVTEFRDPVLFVGHLSEDSVLVMDKPWREVVQTFEAPVHRHIFGT